MVSTRYIKISQLSLPNSTATIPKAKINISPAPLGFPADFFPSCANSLPASLGSMLLRYFNARKVPKKAHNIPITCTNLLSVHPAIKLIIKISPISFAILLSK